MIEARPSTNKGEYLAYYAPNDKHIGYFVIDVDGFYYFFELKNAGHWASYQLRDIADKLDELNKEWEEIIKNDDRIGGVT